MSVLQFTFILVFFFVFVISSVTKKNIFICVKFYWEKWTFMHSFTMILCSLLFFFRYSEIWWKMEKNSLSSFVPSCSIFSPFLIMSRWMNGVKAKKKKKKVSKISKKKISSFFPIPKFSCFLYANFSKALQNNNQIFFLC